jgi:hypothetical protein
MSHVMVELKANVSETCSDFIILVDVDGCSSEQILVKIVVFARMPKYQ